MLKSEKATRENRIGGREKKKKVLLCFITIHEFTSVYVFSNSVGYKDFQNAPRGGFRINKTLVKQ